MKWFEYILCFALVAVCVGLIVATVAKDRECSKSGGVLVRGTYSMQCVKVHWDHEQR